MMNLFHINYGKRILKLNSDRLPSHIVRGLTINGTMPFSFINLIPHFLGQSLKAKYGSNGFIDFLNSITAARYITILFSLLLVFYIFRWTETLYGTDAAVLSTILYALSPTVIAHSGLVTTDIFAAFMIAVSTYYFWKLNKFDGWKTAFLCALFLGLSQTLKYACFLLFPIFFITVLIRYSKDIFNLIISRDFRTLAGYLKIFFKYTLLFIAVTILIINIGFLFNKTFVPLGEYRFRSDSLRNLQSSLSFLKHLPIPVPYPYIEGIDGHLYDEQMGGWTHGALYLFGQLRRGAIFKGYYFYCFLFKEPIAIQLFVIYSIVAYVLRRKKYNFLENELFLFCPLLFCTIILNYSHTMQIGIRHLLIIYPFLFILCGSFFKDWRIFNIKKKAVIFFLFFYLIISVFSYFPHYISYFNELIRERKQTYKILADSNLDWGQNRWYLNKYKEENPDVIINPEYPTAGKVVVSVNDLVGIILPNKYRWLRENFEPLDHIAYSYLVYYVTTEDLVKLK